MSKTRLGIKAFESPFCIGVSSLNVFYGEPRFGALVLCIKPTSTSRPPQNQGRRKRRTHELRGPFQSWFSQAAPKCGTLKRSFWDRFSIPTASRSLSSSLLNPLLFVLVLTHGGRAGMKTLAYPEIMALLFPETVSLQYPQVFLLLQWGNP